MASFTVSLGVDWVETFRFGQPEERWRLDDYDITVEIKQMGSNSVVQTLSTANGKLVIADPLDRILELNLGRAAIQLMGGAGDYRFDFIFQSRGTGLRERDPADGGGHRLTVAGGVTFTTSS